MPRALLEQGSVGMTGRKGLQWWQAVGVLCAAVAKATTVQAAASAGWERCFEQHAERFALDAGLLRAVATVESGLQPRAVGRNSNGSRDLGVMQINSGWLPTLARYGIREPDLLEPCTSIEVGAWILAGLIQRHGDSWEAVGAYNASCSVLTGAACRQARARYAWKVQRALASLASRQATPAAAISASVSASASASASAHTPVPFAPTAPTWAASGLAADAQWLRSIGDTQPSPQTGPQPRLGMQAGLQPGLRMVALADLVRP